MNTFTTEGYSYIHFKDHLIRVNPEEPPQISWDDGVTWERIDISEVPPRGDVDLAEYLTREASNE